MRPTINQLMENIGCQTWPERWKDIYEDVMADFECHGCPMTDPDHIDMLAGPHILFGFISEQRLGWRL